MDGASDPADTQPPSEPAPTIGLGSGATPVDAAPDPAATLAPDAAVGTPAPGEFEVRSELVDPPRPAARADSLVGTRLGSITILRLIAEGGMGRVYEGRQEKPRRPVAVKVIKPGLTSPETLKRFEYEAQVLARLRHQGIAQIHTVGTHEVRGQPVPYFVMEYIPNAKSLTRYAHDGKLSTRDRLELFRKVCEAVAHGHQKGVIHRDLKPGNVLVDSSGQPKVIDFGVARTTDSDMALTTMQTDVGAIIGTLQYMSPEQFDADPHDLDVRLDVYALGVILYELLTGKPPYDVAARSIFEVARVVREEEPKPISSVDKTLRRDVAIIAAKCLQKDRNRRYSSATELAGDVGRYLAGEPITAVPPTFWDAVARLARKHKAAALAVAGIAASLVAAVVGISAFAIRADRARKAAEQAEAAEHQMRSVAETARQAAESATAVAERERVKAEADRVKAEAASKEAARSAALAETRSFITQAEMPLALRRLEDAAAIGLRYPDRLLVGEFLAAARDQWRLVATLPVHAGAVCFAESSTADEHDHSRPRALIAAVGRTLHCLSLHDGTRRTEEAVGLVRELHQLSHGYVAAVHRKSISLWVLGADGLHQRAIMPFEHEVVQATAADSAVVIITRDGVLRLLAVPDLTEQRCLKLADIRRDLAPANRCYVSPDARDIFLNPPWKSPTAWLREDGSTQDVPWLRIDTMEFFAGSREPPTGTRRFLTWFTTSGGGGQLDRMHVNVITTQPDGTKAVLDHDERALNIPSIYTKGVAALRVDDSQFTAFGKVGLVQWSFAESDPRAVQGLRYDQVWPSHAIRFAAADRWFPSSSPSAQRPRATTFALASDEVGLLVFDDYESRAKEFKSDEWCTTSVHDGVFYASGARGRVREKQHWLLSFVHAGEVMSGGGIEVEQPPVEPGRDWTPVAIDVSVDERHGAVIAQESDDTGFTSTSSYYRKCLLLYALADGGRTPESWTLLKTLPLPEFDGTHGFKTHAQIRLSPDGQRAFVAVGQSGAWCDLADGRQEHFVTGSRIIMSNDGRWAAIGTRGQREMRILSIDSGKVVCTVSTVGDGCFSDDGRMLLVADNLGTLQGIDRQTGAVLFERKSSLIPRAWPVDGDWFLGMQPEENAGLAGSLFLAHKETMAAEQLLTRAFARRSQTAFAADRSWIFFDNHRWGFRVVPMLTMDEMRRRMETPHVGAPVALIPAAAVNPAPAGHVSLSEVDAMGFLDRIDETVEVAGIVEEVRLVRDRNAANVTLATKGRPLLVWIPPEVFPGIASRIDLTTEALRGSMVTVHGMVKIYGGRSAALQGLPQVVVDSADDFHLMNGDLP